MIRYGRCNWPAVFSINRHYGPLYRPAPLPALLFLEAPGSSRAPVLALSIPQIFSASLLLASSHISKDSLYSLVKHAVDYEKLDKTEGFVIDFLLLNPHKCIGSEMYDLYTLLSLICHLIILFCPEHLHLFGDL